MTSSDTREAVMDKEEFVLCKGMTVEVSSNEEGFNNAWFTATIVGMTKGKDNKVLIQYRDLLTDDLSKPLREYTHRSFVRPLPPADIADSSNNSPRFKEEDVVDACYKDGWWTGVVCRVSEDEKFFVYFHEPPDVMPFELSELRIHQDWTNGKWIPSKRHSKQLPTNSVFSTGQAVEVKLDDKTFSEMWLSAIFIQDFKGKFLVKYKRPRGGDEFEYINVMANSRNVRPIPNEVATAETEFDFTVSSVPGREDAKYQHEVVSSNNKKRGRLSNSTITSPEAGNSRKKAVKKGLTYNAKDATAGSSSADEDMPLSALSKKPRLPSGKKAVPHAETPQIEVPQDTFSGNDTRSSKEIFSGNDTRRSKEIFSSNDTISNESWPFVKCSPVWNAVESLEVFKRIPQNPHFLPLTDRKEEYREGNAVAMMLTFSCVSEMVAKLECNDPRVRFTSVLETLSDLENHGFDVNGLRVRVCGVLKIKNQISKHAEKRRVGETGHTEATQVIKKKSDEAEMFRNEIAVLQGRLVQVEAEVEKSSVDMSNSLSIMETSDAAIKECLLEFYNLEQI